MEIDIVTDMENAFAPLAALVMTAILASPITIGEPSVFAPLLAIGAPVVLA